MKITELDLNVNGLRYFCKEVNEIFEVRDGNLVAIEGNFNMAQLLEMEFSRVISPYDRVDRGKDYYTVGCSKGVSVYDEENVGFDDEQFDNVNYFNDKNYAEYVFFRDNLMRKLDKFAWERNAQVTDWYNDCSKYCIEFDHKDYELRVYFYCTIHSVNIYFSSKEVAEKALEEFKEDLIKLYTWRFDF